MTSNSTAKSPLSGKLRRVLALLAREEGASVAELIEATGWLPHTAPAALSGLRKKGYAITKPKVDDVTRYRITVDA
ncbi:DNA-binding MarR family transcriptional regulator [Sphingobium subterraneum]|uniref:DNA-binding MarR family transcriptional regulator n=2 Tax=Sphingobium subterraneum TaxID=627688 RepID=A0A841J9U7_9SPHN|nr:DNA-binding MarR family transcriptional regulator [Sphingobium subterraneum]